MLGFAILWPWLGGGSPERWRASPFLPTVIVGAPCGLGLTAQGQGRPLPCRRDTIWSLFSWVAVTNVTGQKSEKGKRTIPPPQVHVSSLWARAPSWVELDLPASTLHREVPKGAFTSASVRNLVSRDKLSGWADPHSGAPPSAQWRPSWALCLLLQGGGPSRVLEASHGPPTPFCLPGQDPGLSDLEEISASSSLTCGETEAQGWRSLRKVTQQVGN